MYARMEFNGLVLKRSGEGFVVGKKRDRCINQIGTEEVVNPHWFGKARDALVYFLRETRGCDDPLSEALWAFMLRTALATTMAPGVHIKGKRANVVECTADDRLDGAADDAAILGQRFFVRRCQSVELLAGRRVHFLQQINLVLDADVRL